MKYLLYLLIPATVAFPLHGCKSQTTSKGYQLTADERKICDSTQFDAAIIQQIREYNSEKVEAFHYSLGKFIVGDKEIESDPVYLKGIVFAEKNSRSYNLVFALKDSFRAKGYSIFLLENNFGFKNNTDRIAVLKTTDKFSVLKQIATDGINYDITNDSLLTIIKNFDKKYDLELIGASGDWCEFIIHKEPADWKQFAKEVYAVCPDIVDQGTGTVEALTDEMKRTKRLYFWWD